MDHTETQTETERPQKITVLEALASELVMLGPSRSRISTVPAGDSEDQ